MSARLPAVLGRAWHGWTGIARKPTAGLGEPPGATSPVSRLIAALAVAVAVVVAAPAIGAVGAEKEPVPSAGGGKGGSSTSHWVNTWVSMPQLTEPHNLPPAPFTQDGLVLADSTLRQTVRVSVGGRQMRLRFSNAFGGVALPVTKVSVALPADGAAGVTGIQAGTSRPVTFSGRPGVTIPVGAQAVSDPLNLTVAARSNLTVTVYLATGQASTNITSHPGSRTSSHIVPGDHVTDQDLTGATRTDHWYFLSGVEVWSPGGAAGVVMLGDSLTDGRGSTTNGNDRWPDQLLDRLQAHPSTRNIAVLNQAAGGNRVMNDGLGPNALARLDRDVLAQSGVEWLLVFEGVNDIGTAAATEAAQEAVAADLIAAYEQIITRTHAKGIRVYGATITAFGGNVPGYDDPEGFRENARQIVNRWIRTSGRFDAVIDFDRVTRDPANPRQLLPAYDTGDHLHLNPTGYKAIADAVPARLFQDSHGSRNFE
jgi:lysophospholipase L1-like esterase